MFPKVFVFLFVHSAFCLPQITLNKNGQVGVKFGEYHAEASLNDSGLGASAGTGFANAGAGADSNSGLYASASHGNNNGNEQKEKVRPIQYEKRITINSQMLNHNGLRANAPEADNILKTGPSLDVSSAANFDNSKQGLFDAIFQIPIATLRAVNNLVNQVSSGATYTKTVRVDRN